MSDSGPGEQAKVFITVPLVTVAQILDALYWDEPHQRDAATALLDCIPEALERVLERMAERNANVQPIRRNM